MANIGKYELETQIGVGGFGRVYRAFDPLVGRKVAIKILLSEDDRELITRFKDEAKAAGTLRHKNIVTVYEYGEHEGKPYLVMEYVEGEDLYRILTSGRKLSYLEKTSIMTQVAEGLQHAHQNGIVHRDVKPANIMIMPDGTVKLMDFGIARIRERTSRLTRTSSILGTLEYMAPEIFEHTDVDQMCDIFSFGVLYYELIAGRDQHPFRAADPARVIYKITLTQPPVVSSLVKDCPAGLDQVISRAMHKDRAIRYHSVEDLLLDHTPIHLELLSEEAQTLSKRAETLLMSGKVADAEAAVRRALQLDPHNNFARRLWEEIGHEWERQSIRDRYDRLVASGRDLMLALQYAKAIENFEEAVQLDPERTEARSLLEDAKSIRKRETVAALLAQARREIKANRFLDADKTILECLRNDPGNVTARSLLEEVRSEQRAQDVKVACERIDASRSKGDLETARSYAAESLLAFPGEPAILALKASIETAIADRDRRRTIANLKPEPASKLDERIGDATSFFNPASSADARSRTDAVSSISKRARALLQEGRLHEAEKLLNDSLTRFPSEVELCNLLQTATAGIVAAILQSAESLGNENRWSEALAILDRGLHDYPNHSKLLQTREGISSQLEIHRRAKRQIVARVLLVVASLIAAIVIFVYVGIPKIGGEHADSKTDAPVTSSGSEAPTPRPSPSENPVPPLVPSETPAPSAPSAPIVPGTSGNSRGDNSTANTELGVLTVDAQPHEAGADVFVNGKKYGSLTTGPLAFQLAPGIYDVSIDKVGFEQSVKTVRILARTNQKVTLALVRTKSASTPEPIATNGGGASPLPDKTDSPTRILPTGTTGPQPPVSPPPVPPNVREWDRLKTSTDIDRLEQFSRDYPGTKEADEAANRVRALRAAEAERAWGRTNRNNLEALGSFLKQYGSSPFAGQAREDLNRLQRDAMAIQQTISDYKSAFESKNVAAIRKLFPEMDEREYRDAFNGQIRGFSWRAGEPSFSADGAAVVECQRSYTFTRQGQSVPVQDALTMTLRRQGGNWQIQSIRAH